MGVKRVCMWYMCDVIPVRGQGFKLCECGIVIM